MDDDVATGLVRHKAFVFDRRRNLLAVIALPTLMILAVEEENPALRFFFGCQFVIRGNYGVCLLYTSDAADE